MALVAGQIDEAARYAREALALTRKLGARSNEAHALWLAGDVGSAAGGLRPLVAHCHFGPGKLYRRTSAREQAQEHVATAATLYRDMGMTYWLEQLEA